MRRARLSALLVPFAAAFAPAWCGPNRVVSTTRTVIVEPRMLSIVIASPSHNSPRAKCNAARALTPEPVADRSTSPSAKMHALRL